MPPSRGWAQLPRGTTGNTHRGSGPGLTWDWFLSLELLPSGAAAPLPQQSTHTLDTLFQSTLEPAVSVKRSFFKAHKSKMAFTGKRGLWVLEKFEKGETN